MADETKPYSVCYWGSHPDDDNDDCWTGADYATEAEARAAFAEPVQTAPYNFSTSTAFVMLDGPLVHEVRANPAYVPPKDSDDSDRRSYAMEQGLLGGCDAYNAAMGWDTNDYSDEYPS